MRAHALAHMTLKPACAHIMHGTRSDHPQSSGSCAQGGGGHVRAHALAGGPLWPGRRQSGPGRAADVARGAWACLACSARRLATRTRLPCRAAPPAGARRAPQCWNQDLSRVPAHNSADRHNHFKKVLRSRLLCDDARCPVSTCNIPSMTA